MGDRICLVVDDEPAIRRYLSALLQRSGIRSLEAENAVGALRILQKLRGQIDLLITDIQMPGDMDGIDLAYSVQNSFSNIPVILISGRNGKAPAGFTFVEKPFMADAILNAIDKTMDRFRPQGTEAADREVPETNSASYRSGLVPPPSHAA